MLQARPLPPHHVGPLDASHEVAGKGGCTADRIAAQGDTAAGPDVEVAEDHELDGDGRPRVGRDPLDPPVSRARSEVQEQAPPSCQCPAMARMPIRTPGR